MHKTRLTILLAVISLALFGMAGVASATEHVEDCSLSTTYCVDDTAGPTQEYSTIQVAINAAKSGDTVLVYPGTYNESSTYSWAGTKTTVVYIDASKNGTSTNPTVIKATAPGVILDGQGAVNNCFWGRDLSYVIIDGFECTNIDVQGASSNTGAIQFWQSSHMIIQNNNIHNIIASDPENRPAIMLTMSDSTIKNNIINISSVGIAGGMSGYLFERNIIDGNIIDLNGVGSGTYFSQNANDYVIRNNYIYNYGLAGIQVRDSVRAKIYNNIVYSGHGFASNSWISYGMNLRDWPHTGPGVNCDENEYYEVYNNIIDDATYAFALTQLNNTTFKNNIITNVSRVYLDTEWQGGGGSCQVGVQPSKGIVMDYNIYYNYAVTLIADNNNNMEYVDGGHNLNNIDPKFVASGNRPAPYYELQSSSPAINTGDSNISVGADFLGVGRPQGSAFDLGAFEYISFVLDTTPPSAPQGLVVN